MPRPARWTILAAIAVSMPLAVAVQTSLSATIDLSGLTLRETHARVLTPSDVEISCTPTGGDRFCAHSASPFTPADLLVNCGKDACVIQVDLCLDYTLEGTSAIGGVALEVDGAPLTPGPGFAILPSTGLDPNHNRACVTEFAAGLERGSHTVTGKVGVDNNSSAVAATITVRSATMVVRVYR
jgi:hypothetical protein